MSFSSERLLQLAEMEDGRCISVGGMAVDLGLYKEDRCEGCNSNQGVGYSADDVYLCKECMEACYIVKPDPITLVYYNLSDLVAYFKEKTGIDLRRIAHLHKSYWVDIADFCRNGEGDRPNIGTYITFEDINPDTYSDISTTAEHSTKVADFKKFVKENFEDHKILVDL